MFRWSQFTAVLILISILAAAYVVPLRTNTEAAFYQYPDDIPVLIVDPGHGGEDGGAVSSTGTSESQINLAIALRLDNILGLLGVPVTMTRREDISLHSPGAATLREKKRSDLQNRTALVQGQKNAILLSIHQNSYPNPRFSGAQVFFAPTDGSDLFARTLQDTLRSALDPNNSRQAALISDSIYLMNHISCCAVLVECGFLTNPQEEAKLLSTDYQIKTAAALAGGYMCYRQMISDPQV